jgi:hypothetical protein
VIESLWTSIPTYSVLCGAPFAFSSDMDWSQPWICNSTSTRDRGCAKAKGDVVVELQSIGDRWPLRAGIRTDLHR